MGHTAQTFQFRTICCAFLASLLLLHCGGGDHPYTVPSKASSNPSTIPAPPTNVSHLKGCAISFASQLVLETKGGPSLGDIKSDPRPLQEIPLRFAGSEVAMLAQEFPTIDLVIEGAPAAMRIQQKEGSSAQGTYDSNSGQIELDNVIFVVTLLDKTSLAPLGLAPIEMSPLSLSTGSVNQNGKFGALQMQGAALDSSSKHITLVGGLNIPESFPSEDLKGASLVVSFSGSLSDLPSSGNCSGSFASGLGFKSITNSSEGEVEQDLADHTLGFDRVYVPQAGVDAASAGDSRFFSHRILRVKNNTDAAIHGNIQSTENFKIAPLGNVAIPAGAFRDFQIEFSAKPATDYSEQAVPANKTISSSLNFESGSVKLQGDLRRAAPELVIRGTEENAASTVDLGIVPAQVLGSGPSSKLDCRPLPGNKVPLVSRQVSIENHGIRPLQILKINHALDSRPQSKDPFCGGFPNEFIWIGLKPLGSSHCNTLLQNGKIYLTDQCALPDSQGELSFKVLYFPVNASSVSNAVNNVIAPDTGSLTVESNDPRYNVAEGKEPFKLNLSSGVSPDQSNVLRIQKEGSSVEVNTGANIRLNISNSTDLSLTQKLILLNHLDQALNGVKISIEDASHFEILPNPSIPSQIPAMPGNSSEPGKAEFLVKFNKPPGMTQGDIATRLKVKFTPANTSNENIFEINLIGSVNHQVLTGDVKMKIDFISSYFDTNLLKSSPIESEDFRTGQFNAFRPGDLKFIFSEVPGAEHLRHVTMVHTLNVDPFNPNLLQAILNLTPEDRKEVLRVYSTRLSGYPGGLEDGNHDGIPDCVEPLSLKSPFEASHCSFFYYIFSTKPGKDGIYNDETGELFFPDVKLRLLNPYHATVLDFNSNLLTDTELKASVATLTFDSLIAGDQPLVPDPRLSSSEIAVPDDLASTLLSNIDTKCPEGWLPWDPAKKPAFGCFMNPSSPHYMKGYPARPLNHGEYSIVLSLVTKLNPAGPPDHVPSFMANGRMWVGILGRLIQGPPK